MRAACMPTPLAKQHPYPHVHLEKPRVAAGNAGNGEGG